MKIFWGADDGNVTGPKRFHANVAAVMLVHVGLATLLAARPGRESKTGNPKSTRPYLHPTPPARPLGPRRTFG
jgi:hypothetical protein